MLFIIGRMSLGGIETFILRIAKYRYSKKLHTKILLISDKNKSDPDILRETQEVAEVIFIKDLYSIRFLKILPIHFLLLFPFNKRLIASHFENIDHVHVSTSFSALLFNRLAGISGIKTKLSIGVYHSLEFIWGTSNQIPFYEVISRYLFKSLLAKNSVVFFNDRMQEIYEKYGYECKNAANFPIGVCSENNAKFHRTSRDGDEKKLQIISIGRLVRFKTYNLWMIDVVKELKNMSVDVCYDIFGYGPLEDEILEKIAEENLGEAINLRGALEYNEFQSTVAQYDIFVGSGTAIVEACFVGVPSIVGIESKIEAKSYGFCSSLPSYSYNEDGLYEKIDVVQILKTYLDLTGDEKNELSRKHKVWAKQFSMEQCFQNFENVNERLGPHVCYEMTFLTRLKYSLSYFLFSIRCKILRKTPIDFVTSGRLSDIRGLEQNSF